LVDAGVDTLTVGDAVPLGRKEPLLLLVDAEEGFDEPPPRGA
jgi:hypothetical protein